MKAFFRKYKKALIIFAVLVSIVIVAAVSTFLILDSQKKALAQAESQLASFDAKYNTAVSNVEVAFNYDVSKKAELRTQVDAVIPEVENLSADLTSTYTEIGKIKLTQEHQARITKELVARQADVENLQALVFSVNYGLDSLDFFISNYSHIALTNSLVGRLKIINEQNPELVRPYLEQYITSLETFANTRQRDTELEAKLLSSRLDLISQLKNDAN